MKIGILELLCEDVNRPIFDLPHDFFAVKQYASIMPQAVSTWCRQLGHQVYYNTFYGFGKPETLLPDDLDIVFISCFSRGSATAYALSKLFKIKNPNITTILGGPHAKQFSADSARFFDIVVKNCDKTLIKEILIDLPKNQIIYTDRPLTSLPSLKERLPEIKKAFFWRGKPSPFVFTPILASIGCPYACDFCVDWKTNYRLFSLDQLEADLQFAAQNFPQVKINFYDPNFGVEFDKVMAVIERIAHPRKRWFLTEGSLDALTDERLERLEKAGCMCVIPGIESWTAYTKKTGIEKPGNPAEKLDRIVQRFKAIHRHIPITQANLIFGLDADKGDEPVALNMEFINQTPWVSHTLNIPAPFGETPMFKKLYRKNRILETLPFTFYCKPYLAIIPKNYSPIEFYEKLIRIFDYMTSPGVGLKGFRMSRSFIHKGYQPIRTLSLKQMTRTMNTILDLLKTDPEFRRFHEGKTQKVPEFYHRQYEALLGPYKDLVSRTDRIPVLTHEAKHTLAQRKCA